jgi:hypothetical protein
VSPAPIRSARELWDQPRDSRARFNKTFAGRLFFSEELFFCITYYPTHILATDLPDKSSMTATSWSRHPKTDHLTQQYTSLILDWKKSHVVAPFSTQSQKTPFHHYQMFNKIGRCIFLRSFSFFSEGTLSYLGYASAQDILKEVDA